MLGRFHFRSIVSHTKRENAEREYRESWIGNFFVSILIILFFVVPAVALAIFGIGRLLDGDDRYFWETLISPLPVLFGGVLLWLVWRKRGY